MRGATTVCRTCHAIIHISIHAPHAGRDREEADVKKVAKISIHAPHAGRDLKN